MEKQVYKLTITFNEPILGSQPGADTPAADFVKAKAAAILAKTGDDVPDDEIAPDLEKGTTGFYRLPTDPAAPCLMDYQVKGFLKESGLIQNGARNVKNLRSKIGNLVFVRPRHIPLIIPDGGGITFNERPLRAMTMQGPRTSLARSEQLPAGTRIECTVIVLVPVAETIKEDLLRDLLDYGEFQGLGQWRNASWGSFTYALERV